MQDDLLVVGLDLETGRKCMSLTQPCVIGMPVSTRAGGLRLDPVLTAPAVASAADRLQPQARPQ